MLKPSRVDLREDCKANFGGNVLQGYENNNMRYIGNENISIKRRGRVTRMNDITNGILLEIPRSRTVAYKNSFYVRAPSVWNTLPKDLRDTTRSVSSFKTNLCQFYNKLLDDIFDPEDSRTYKTVCIKCHSTRSLLLRGALVISVYMCVVLL